VRLGSTQAGLTEMAKPFFIAMYGQPPGTSMEYTRFKLFTKKKKGPQFRVMPPISINMFLHILLAHLLTSADQLAPPNESADITQFDWEIRDGVPAPIIAQAELDPSYLCDMIHYEYRVEGKNCSTAVCGCHK